MAVAVLPFQLLKGAVYSQVSLRIIVQAARILSHRHLARSLHPAISQVHLLAQIHVDAAT